MPRTRICACSPAGAVDTRFRGDTAEGMVRARVMVLGGREPLSTGLNVPKGLGIKRSTSDLYCFTDKQCSLSG